MPEPAVPGKQRMLPSLSYLQKIGVAPSAKPKEVFCSLCRNDGDSATRFLFLMYPAATGSIGLFFDYKGKHRCGTARGQWVELVAMTCERGHRTTIVLNGAGVECNFVGPAIRSELRSPKDV